MPEESKNFSINALSTLSFLGIWLGLFIIYIQLNAAGLLSLKAGNTTGNVNITFCILGAVIVAISFLGFMRCKYGIVCLLPPEFSQSLRGNESKTVKAIVILILVFVPLSVVFVMVMLKYHDEHPSNYLFYVANIAWTIIFIILLFLYNKFRKINPESPMISEDTRSLLGKLLGAAEFLALVPILLYFESHPLTGNPTILWLSLLGTVSIHLVRLRVIHRRWLLVYPDAKSTIISRFESLKSIYVRNRSSTHTVIGLQVAIIAGYAFIWVLNIAPKNWFLSPGTLFFICVVITLLFVIHICMQYVYQDQ
jgi:membrane protein YdbS with pleckstrin-like domain